MVINILIAVYLFSSIGIFVKLRRYGAPISSFLYSGLIPIAAIIGSIKFVNDELKDKSISFIKKSKMFISFELDCLKNISIITGVFCIKLGKNKIGILDIYMNGPIKIIAENIKNIVDEFNSIKNVGINIQNAYGIRAK
ncbi:hypothetical protein FDA48_03950 [Clostridium botulinum]|nr:hypothetical protein [Clostridium botulinum]